MTTLPSRRRSPAPPPAHIDPVRYTPFFSRGKGRLFCEGVALDAIAARAGTPAYAYSRAAIEANYRALDSGLDAVPHAICYAVKANSNLAVLRVLAALGSSFDIVSGGELYRLRRIGVPGDRIVFSGVGKSREEIREALAAGILLFNIESSEELDLLIHEASRARIRASASVRVNPDVDAGGHPHISTGRHHHKFGVDWPEAKRLYLAHRSSLWIRWRGISAHIGSQILSMGPYRVALRRLGSYVAELRAAGIALRYFDLGGGLGVRYTDEKPPDLAAYAQEIAAAARPLGCKFLIEPGRSIVGPAGVLLMRVLYTKRTRGKTFVVVDAAMNDFMRPALYSAVHPITPARLSSASSRRGASRKIRADIVGPVCETGDAFLHDWLIEEPSPGDVLALWGAGAYGFVESSNYNARPRPVEILVEGRKFRVIRRRETPDDLLRGELP
ncbi:MAG: diaminopimelate decarboxylase [Candidatus Acidiferrales bacterium]